MGPCGGSELALVTGTSLGRSLQGWVAGVRHHWVWVSRHWTLLSHAAAEGHEIFLCICWEKAASLDKCAQVCV